MSSVQGINHGKRPVLEIRKGKNQFWKTQGWTTPNTSMGLAQSIPLPGSTTNVLTEVYPPFMLSNGDFAVPAEKDKTYDLYNSSFQKLKTVTLPGGVYHSSLSPNEKRMIHATTGSSNNDVDIYDPEIFGAGKAIEIAPSAADGIMPHQIASADDGSYVYLRDYTGAAQFRSPTGAKLAEQGSAYAVSYYDGHYYVLVADGNDVKRPALKKFDLLGKLLSSTPLTGVDLYTSVSVNLARSSLVSTYDAAGNIFWTQNLESGTNKLYKITTQGTVTSVTINQLFHQTRLETDALGNVYFIRAATRYASTTTGNFDIVITKVKNDMTIEWEKSMTDAAIRGAWYVTRSGLIYLFKWADNTKRSYALNVYQQTNI